MPSATLYTPVFPPSLPIPSSPSSSSITCDTKEYHAKVKKRKPYIDRLKERYILLASIPQDELCPPSREPSPEFENRIQALRLRMRKARELRFPHDPGLTLTCSGVRGGDWVGELVSGSECRERQYRLATTEEEWFGWERKRKVALERKMARRKAAEDRRKITKWSEGLENPPGELEEDAVLSQAQPLRAVESGTLRFPVVKNSVSRAKVKDLSYRSRRSPSRSSRCDSEPVERMSSPIPPEPPLEAIPSFSGTLSLSNSPPSLPQLPLNNLIPENVPRSPSFALKSVQISTPRRQDPPSNPVFQLSSPISPPRDLPLSASVSSGIPARRSLGGEEPAEDIRTDGKEAPSTPRNIPQHVVEPITPASVPRATCSQEQTQPSNIQQLPTLSSLLTSAKRAPHGKSKVTVTPHRDGLTVPEISPSQPTYSMFRPQFQSTQPRARSLPPSPSNPLTFPRPISPKISQESSSGIFYQSQVNVEGRIAEVAEFLDADVWEVGR